VISHQFQMPNISANLQRTIGGHISDIGNWPWTIKLFINDGFMCTESILSENYILTAAHCIPRKGHYLYRDTDNEYIQAGTTSCKDQEIIRINVSESWVHPDFLDDEYGTYGFNTYNDIALIKLETPINFFHYPILRPICLVDNFKEYIGSIGVYTGFGMFFGYNETDWSGCFMHENIIPFQGADDCRKAYYFFDSEKQICAGGHKRGVSHGDSGGPLVYNFKGIWYQVGLADVLRTEGVERDAQPDSYTRISPFCEWITENSDGEVQCKSIFDQ